MILTIIVTLVIFGVLITTHEFGHFIAARKCGVIVEEFSIGMGPLLFEKKGDDGTLYSLRLLPIGGFCRMYGEDEDENELGEGSLNSVSPWKRILILSAGAMMNLLTAIIILMMVYAIYGTEPTTTVSTVMDNSPAYNAGVHEGDTILKIGTRDIKEWQDLDEAIAGTKGKETAFQIERADGNVETIYITPKYDAEQKDYLIGITPTYSKSLAGTVKMAFKAFFTYVFLIFKALIQLIRGTIGINEMSGPIGVAGVVGDAIKMGPAIVLNIAALLAVNIGVFNLLPIPALDGSRIFFCLIEIMKGSPIDREKEGMVHFVGFMLLMALTIFIAVQDIIKII